MTTIDAPDGIAHFQMARCIAALRIEVNTGLKLSGRRSMLRLVQDQYGVTAKTKAKGLAQLEQLYLDTYGKEYGKP